MVSKTEENKARRNAQKVEGGRNSLTYEELSEVIHLLRHAPTLTPAANSAVNKMRAVILKTDGKAWHEIFNEGAYMEIPAATPAPSTCEHNYTMQTYGGVTECTKCGKKGY